jgi:hypothetical protein
MKLPAASGGVSSGIPPKPTRLRSLSFGAVRPAIHPRGKPRGILAKANKNSNRSIAVDISEPFFGKGTAGRAFEIFFEIEGFLPVTEGDRSFYAPGFVFRSMMNIPGIMCL